MRHFGFVQPVLARRADGVVIGGHQRLTAARRLGQATVPVIWLDLSADDARLLGLALNKINGSWDEQLLARLLSDLQAEPGADLRLSGFDEVEVRDLVRSLEERDRRERAEQFDLEAALEEATRTPRSKSDELWRLGDHRLFCGDSVKIESLERCPVAHDDGRRSGRWTSTVTRVTPMPQRVGAMKLTMALINPDCAASKADAMTMRKIR